MPDIKLLLKELRKNQTQRNGANTTNNASVTVNDINGFPSMISSGLATYWPTDSTRSASTGNHSNDDYTVHRSSVLEHLRSGPTAPSPLLTVGHFARAPHQDIQPTNIYVSRDSVGSVMAHVIDFEFGLGR